MMAITVSQESYIFNLYSINRCFGFWWVNAEWISVIPNFRLQSTPLSGMPHPVAFTQSIYPNASRFFL